MDGRSNCSLSLSQENHIIPLAVSIYLKPKPEVIPQQKRGRSPEISDQHEEPVQSTRRASSKRRRTDAGPPLDLAPPDFDQGMGIVIERYSLARTNRLVDLSTIPHTTHHGSAWSFLSSGHGCTCNFFYLTRPLSVLLRHTTTCNK